MATTEHLMSRILDIASHGQGRLPVETADLLQDYRKAVDEVNRRLSDCVSLLRKGLRAEAIHLAELSPNLLDQAAALDVPDFDPLAELAHSLEIDSLPMVDIDLTGELNDAYVIEQQLEGLMKNHRRLAIGRAPLAGRIKTIRRLAALDPNNGIWGDDQRELERARLKEIDLEVRAAIERRDAEQLAALGEELASDEWLEPVPGKLSGKLNQAMADMKRRRLLQELSAVQSAVVAGFRNHDREAAEAALATWQQMVERMKENPEKFKSPDFRDATEWLADMRRQDEQAALYEQNLAGVEQALDRGLTGVELEKRWSRLERMGYAIPKGLLARYRNRTEELRLDQARRFKLKVGAAAAVLLLIAAGLGYFIFDRLQEQEIIGRVNQVQAQVDEGNWSAAGELLSRFETEHPRAYRDPRMVQLAGRVGGELSRIAAADEAFEQAMNRLVDAGLEADDPVINEADRLARTPEQKGQVQAKRQEIMEFRFGRQQQADQAARARLAGLQRQLEEMTPFLRSPDEQAIEEMREINRGFETLLSESPGISEPLRGAIQQQYSLATSSLEEAAGRFRLNEQMHRDLASIARNRMTVQQYRDMVEQFTTEYPRHRETVSLREALADVERWMQASPTASRLPNWPVLRVDNLREAESRLAVVRQVVEAGAGPWSGSLDAYAAYLDQAVRSLSPRELPQVPGTRIHNVINNPLIANVFFVDVGNPAERLYVNDRSHLTVERGRVTIRPFLTTEQAFGFEPLGGREYVVREHFNGRAPELARAPQSLFAEAANKMITESPFVWETFHVDMLALLGRHADIDPILAATIAQQLTDRQLEMGWPKETADPAMDALRLWHNQVRQLNTSVAWMNPEDVQARRTRPQAATVMRSQPDMSRIRSLVDRWEQSLRPQLQRRQEIGCIWFEGDVPSVRFFAGTAGTSGRWQLEMIEPEGESIRFAAIGQMESGRPTFNSGVRLRNGMLVVGYALEAR